MAQTGAENRANHDSDDIVHIINNREWTEEQKRKLVEIDREARWDTEYTVNRRTVQNQMANARRFKKEGWMGKTS